MATNNTTPRVDLFEIATDIVLTDFSGKEYTLTGSKAEVQVASLIVYESLDTPYMLAEMSIIDSGVNMIGNIPIQGTEKVTFGLKTPYFSDKEYKYEFRISAVRNRQAGGKIQTYTLDLISFEGLQNEALRIAKTWDKYAHEIVEDVIKNYFKTKKEIIDLEKTKYKIKMIPRGQRPFDLIYSLLSKSVSTSYAPASAAGATTSLPASKTASTSGTTDINPQENISGTAGYFFWETQEGYKFKSIDGMCSDASNVKDTFNFKLAKIESNKDTGRNIIEYKYTNEIDVLKKMRNGTYSSMMVFFNPSTGRYDEYVFDIEKSYKSMQHLGKDEKLPEGPKELSKYPTRIMTQFLDDETFYNGNGIASIDPKDNDGQGTAFPDYKKFYMSQSISRKLLLHNQELRVTVHGNLTLRAGDKINILLPKFAVDEQRETEKYDTQHSGTYLIKDISYEFYLQKNNTPNVTVTNMTVVRDSFGVFNLDV